LCSLFKINNSECITGEQYIPTRSICLFVHQWKTLFNSVRRALLLTFIGFSLLTGQCRQLIDVSGSFNENDIGARDRFMHLNTDKPVDIGDGNRMEDFSMHGVGQKMRVASRVTSEHGLACSAFGVRPPSLELVLSNGLCVHTCPAFRYIYISACTRMPYIRPQSRANSRD